MGFGANLKILLKEKGITIKELSEVTGISKNTLYSITKRDTRLPNDEIISKIAKALNMEYGELLTYDEMKQKISGEFENMEKNVNSIENTLATYPGLIEDFSKDELDELIEIIKFVKSIRTQKNGEE